MPLDVRYDKGPQFSDEFEDFLKDIHVNLTPGLARNPLSNSLTKSAVKSAKLLLRKSIEEKTYYDEMLGHFNQSPWEDGNSPSEIFHGCGVRSYLPTLDDSINEEGGKVARKTQVQGNRHLSVSQLIEPVTSCELYYLHCVRLTVQESASCVNSETILTEFSFTKTS